MQTYPRILDDKGKVLYNPLETPDIGFEDVPCYKFLEMKSADIVRIPLPRKSLLVFYGSPRYQMEHCIMREDIVDRRIVIAYREFTPTYLPGGKDHLIGEEILGRAKQFWDK